MLITNVTVPVKECTLPNMSSFMYAGVLRYDDAAF